MLRVVPFKSAARASEYYTQALAKEDYYSQGKQTVGIWKGKAAEMLGLSGEVKAGEFEALANNLHPETGEQLTQRMRKDRVSGADFCFGVPKSVSLLYAMTGDQRIIDALQNAVDKMMEAVEQDIPTRVRIGRKYEDRTTANFAYANFVHHTSRPVGGIPDPHLHCHCFVFNFTWDAEEKKYKAIKFRIPKQNAPYYEAIGRAYLAMGLKEIGYEVRKVGKAFEIVGFPRSLIQKYSRRSMQIDRLIAELGIEDAKAKDKIGAQSREKKSSSLSPEQILDAWVARMDDDERRTISEVVHNRGRQTVKAVSAEEAVDYAMHHCFVRKPVIKTRDLFREAVAHGYGSLLPEEILAEIDRRNLFTGEIRGIEYCTAQSVVDEERAVLDFVRRGKGRYIRFYPSPYQVRREFLSDEQRGAVRHFMHSKNQVVGLQGSAGVGKTTLMAEVAEAVEAKGKRVFAFSPTSTAAETLQEEGFKEATTLARLLSSPKLQRAVRGQVIWVDEAGLVGTEDMLRLFRIAGRNTRIFLTGDINQHSAVSRGQPFEQLLHTGVLSYAQVKAIIRQEKGAYRQAARAFAEGDIETGFDLLQQMQAVHEIVDSRKRYRALAVRYVACLENGESPLLIAPTHAEGRKVTAAIRKRMHEANILGPDQEFSRLEDQRWSDPQKGREELYQAGLVVQFRQNAKGGIVRGSRFEVAASDKNGNPTITDEKGNQRILNLAEAGKFDVFKTRDIQLSRGEIIRMTRNGYFKSGRRYSNGQTYKITRIYPSGSIKLSNGELIKKDFGHLAYGYSTTSVSAQSRTAPDSVLVAQSSHSAGASSLKQAYVTITRGKRSSKLHIYTDNIEELKKSVSKANHDLSAIEFSGLETTRTVTESEQQDHSFPYDVSDKERDIIFNKKGEFRYTPGFIKHDVGGSFEQFVSYRRNGFSMFTPELKKQQREHQQGKSVGWSEAKARQKAKWSDHLNKKRGVIRVGEPKVKVTGNKLGQGNWLERTKARKADWKQHLGAQRKTVILAKDQKPERSPLAKESPDAKSQAPPQSGATKKPVAVKKPGKGMPVYRGMNIGGENLKRPPVTQTAKSKAKSTSAAAKGKSKGKCKATTKKAKAPPKPVIIVRKK